MNEWILNLTVNALLHGTLVFAVAVAADRLVLRQRVSAQGRYLVFLGVLFLFLVPGFWDLRIPEAEAAVVPAVVSEAFFSGEAEKGMMPGNGEPSVVSGDGSAAADAAWFSGSLGWSVIWGIGFVSMLWHLRKGRRWMRQVVAASREGDGVVWTDSVGPCVTGCRRPVVLVPESCRSFSEEEMGWILAHERSHIARKDLWGQLGQQVVLAVLWFHPLVWWTNRHINRLREFAVDVAVTQGRHDRSVYCEVLIRVASMTHRKPFWGAGLAMASSSGSSKQRLEERIRNCLSPSERRRGWHWLALALPVLLLGVPGGCQTGSIEEDRALPALASVPQSATRLSLDVSEEVAGDRSQINMDVWFVQALRTDVPAGMLDGSEMDAAAMLKGLSALKSSDVLVAPSVITLENESARIEIGRSVPIPAEGTNDIDYVDTGVFVEIVARLDDVQSEFGPAIIAFDVEIVMTDLVTESRVRSQELATSLVAESGTMHLIGRMEQTDQVTKEDVSWFGLVRSTSVEDVERMTFVFLTPTLMNEAEAKRYIRDQSLNK